MPINLQKAEFILSAASPKDFIRDELPQVAFAGRSNVGKSSVINRLLNRKNLARVGAAPGKTTHINYFNIDGAFYLVDLPGYGYAKVSKGERDRWGKLMESYFADRSQMTLGVMIVDSRHKPTDPLLGREGDGQGGAAPHHPGQRQGSLTRHCSAPVPCAVPGRFSWTRADVWVGRPENFPGPVAFFGKAGIIKPKRRSGLGAEQRKVRTKLWIMPRNPSASTGSGKEKSK